MGTNSMSPMSFSIMLLAESQPEPETRQSCRWRLPRKGTAEIPIGAGTGLEAVWSGAPVSCRGVGNNAAI